MDGNDERNIAAVDGGRIVAGLGSQGNAVVSVLNSSYSTVKIDSLSIKLGIVKEKGGDAPKCRHFSIRGYVAGMREKGNYDVSPFTEELQPMDIPKFRYWFCQRCLQNNGTEDDLKESQTVSWCDQCLARPSIEGTVLPFGEGTSGVKSVDNRNDDDSIVASLRADESQTVQEIHEKVDISQENPKFSSVDVNVVSLGKNENKEVRDHEDPEKVCLLSQPPIESGQQDDCQNGHPRRKARKVRLLKELMCGNKTVESPKQKNENSPPLVDSNKIKRKLLHDHDHDHERVHDHSSADSKKTKHFKGNTITKNVVEHSKNPDARKGEETGNIPRKSILGNVGSDIMTAWRTIFSDMVRTENQVPPSYDVSKGRGTEPYSNFMALPKSNKKVNFSKKITKKPVKSKYLGEDLRRMKDSQSDRELGLGLSLNFDPQSQIRSPPFIPSRTPTQDHCRKSSIFFRESDIHDVSNRHPPKTQFPYSSCSGHQKLGYSDIARPRKHQSEEKTFAIGRSDEREIIELLAKNQYERNLSEARSHFAPNGIIPNTSGLTSSPHHGYHNVVWPSTNVAPTIMRNSDGGFFHQDKVSSFTMFDSLTQTQKKPSTNGFWISDSGPQRHYESRYDHNVYNNLTNMQVLEGYNWDSSAVQQNEARGQRFSQPFGQPFSQPYPKYSEKDKGKNMMDLDLNVVAPNVVDEQNNLESFRLLDSSYSNDAIPAMQLLSLMDAGKSSQPFDINSQKFTTRTLSPCYSNCSSTVTEKTNSMVNSHFPYSGLSPSVQNPIPSSFSSVFQSGQNIQLTSTQSQQVYHKPQDEKSKGPCSIAVNHGFRQERNYIFPVSWHGTENRNKLVNGGTIGNRFDSPRTDICVINRNPADFTTPGPENEFMISPEDLRFF